MKNALIIMSAAGIIFSWLPSQVYAEGSWLDNGVNILNNLNQGTEGKSLNITNDDEIGEAFKQALHIGTENVVSKLGTKDGFNADPSIHIPLPEELKTIKTLLSQVGMSQLSDELELKLNRAAESATQKAKQHFFQAINDMTFEDIMKIYEGPENSATNFFQSKMSPPLKKEMQPIVANTLSQVGAIKAYDQVIGQYNTLPFMPDVKTNLTEHVIQKGLEGIFFYVAKEEASIRKDPARQTTALLKKVFGIK
ncbi:hypothetical protein VT98_12311 [Candidatus Electrothrix communis]|uniref:DUF4197 domain-containing protein n=1 Tax=Candidatus Electrothrix communis TaxID=1859133 RepID=A0A3S3QGZ7_9BACT|nr:hypothetical protein VT98_12311 [Candidatus Electrothrix communis]